MWVGTPRTLVGAFADLKADQPQTFNFGSPDGFMSERLLTSCGQTSMHAVSKGGDRLVVGQSLAEKAFRCQL